MARAWHEFEGLPHDKPEGPEFDAMVEQWARAAYKEAAERLSEAKMVEGKYELFRAMRVSPEWVSQIRNGIKLGVYWTFAPDEWDFRPVWGAEDGGIEVVITALVSPESINWESTVLTNMEWDGVGAEHEMRLLPGKPIQVVQVTGPNDQVLSGPFDARA